MWKRSSAGTAALQVGRSGTLSAPFLFLLSSPHLSSSTPECVLMVWPSVKRSIVHWSMSSWPLGAPKETHCPCWRIITVPTNVAVISGSLIQRAQSFKSAFVFGFCSSGCSRATKSSVLVTVAFISNWMNCRSKSSLMAIFPLKPVCPQGKTPGSSTLRSPFPQAPLITSKSDAFSNFTGQ